MEQLLLPFDPPLESSKCYLVVDGEGVIPVAAVSERRVFVGGLVIEIDGRQLAEVIASKIPGALKRYGLHD